MQISTALSRAIVAFAATNLDDIFVLTFFFAQKNLQIWRVVLGQYLGIAGLILVSLVGFFASLIIPYKWIGFLGLIPIAIGIRKDRYGHILVPFIFIGLGLYILFASQSRL
jgi:cadmium resistance protein CadD (predicted permease)